MDLLPPLIRQPVHAGEAGLELRLPGRHPVPIRRGTEPVLSFEPGWQADSLFTLFDPVWVLVLRHEAGHVASWHLASDGSMTVAVSHRPEPERLRFRRRLEPAALWLRMAPGAAIRLPVPDAVRAYAALPAPVRREVEPLLGLDCSTEAAASREPPAGSWPAGDAAPLLLERIGDSRSYRIGNPGRLLPVTDGGRVAELGPGWEVESVQAAFAPLLALVLRHADGWQAAWFVDLDARLVGHHAGALSPSHQAHVLRVAGGLLRTLWDCVVLDKGVLPPDLRALSGGLAPADLDTLVQAHLRDAGQDRDTLVWALDQPMPEGTGYLVPTDTGLRGLDPEQVRACLAPRLHEEMDRLLRTGRMCWPSPVDGASVESDGFALMLDLHAFAYRFRQDSTGLVFLVVCVGGYFSNLALYFPTADLLVAANRNLAGDCAPFRRGREMLLRHLLRFGPDLSAGAAVPPDPTVQQFFGACADHIGHYVWQDLCGMSYLLRAVADHGRLPQLHLFEQPHTTDYFGPVEQVFPMFENRTTRHAERFVGGQGRFYRRNQRVIKYTATTVPFELGRSVIDCAERVPGLADARREADAARARPAPVVLLGIRVGSRTLDDLHAFYAALVLRLGQLFPGCTVVLDGMNDALDRGRAVEPGTSPGGILEKEFALADGLARVAERAEVRFVDLINRSALRSVLWCSRTDAFIAPLGAALAKYRWICNTPGLVLSSRWNLEHRADLHIYDSAEHMERPTEVLFNALDQVRDTTPFRPSGHHDGHSNFVVDRLAVFAAFTDLVRRHSAAR